MTNRIFELEKLIKKHKGLYYEGKPEITDHEFDQLEEELRGVDPENQVLKLVGSSDVRGKKIAHKTKMLSLNKVYTVEELLKWKEEHEILSTQKIDGVSCSLIYKKGALSVAKTRGDGSKGEDITAKAIWVPSIPSSTVRKENFEVRGEVFCTEESFFHLSEKMVSEGLEKPTSMRNIVAGLLSRKDHLGLCQFLSFKGFELLGETEQKKEADKFRILEEIGFDIPEYEIHKNEKSINRVIDEARVFMSEGNYQIDGLVFAINDIAVANEMGETSHHPKYKMAFKFQGESKKTKIRNILWGVSRNGILTPVADVEPVEISGAMISRVTLHNYGMVKQYNLKKEDEIEIIRSGEVIPKFMSVINPSSKKLEVPAECPSCDEKVIIDDIRLRCTNEACPAVVKEAILNFIQKIGIDDLSSKRLEEMIKKELVKSIPDIYRLKKEDLLTLEKVKDKLASKLLSSIEKTKSPTMTLLLSSLGIQGGAYNKCEKVVEAGFDTVAKLKGLTVDKLMEVESFAEKSATDFLSSLSSKWSIVDELLELGIQIEDPKEKSGNSLAGEKICITGSLSEKRSVIEKRIKDHGGSVVGSVSKNTTYLLTNEVEVTSSKHKKAVELGIKVISEKSFIDLVSS